MNRSLTLASLPALAVLAALALPPSGCSTEPSPPDATPIPKNCTTKVEADATPECALGLDTEVQGYLGTMDEADWWLLDVSSLPPRALLTVTAQYKALSSPVILTVNVMKADGTSSIASGRDPRRASSSSAGGPGPAQAVARMTETGQYYVVVRHDTSVDDPALDKKNPYFLTASLGSDPDLNEPNDEAAKATKLAVTACNTPVTVKGALSTKGDKDVFELQVTPCPGSARSILYLEAKAPASPTLQIRLGYSLNTTAGVVASDFSRSPMTDQVLSTARLTSGGKYTVTLQAWRAPSDLADPPGDLTFQYTLKAAVYADQDPNEGTGGNDTEATATATGLATGQSKTVSGRLSYVGDKDIFSVTAPTGAAARLHYKLTYKTAAGQFTPVPTTSVHQVLVYTTATPVECNANCKGQKEYVAAYCGQGQCLKQQRLDDVAIDNFANFEGQLFVPGNSGNTYVQVSFVGGDGADDLTYDLALSLKAPGSDPHPESNAQVVNLPADGTTVLSWGYGQKGPTIPNGSPRLQRSVQDYDAEFDRQWFEFRFPAASADQTLDLAWSISPAPGQSSGQRAYEAGLHFFFCADAACSKKVGVPSANLNSFFGYNDDKVYTWYSSRGGDAGVGLPTEVKAFDFEQGTGTFRVRPAMCTCLDAAYGAAGKLLVAADPYNRTTYADSTLKVSVSLKGYPQSVTDDDGKAFTCPTPCKYVGAFAGEQD